MKLDEFFFSYVGILWMPLLVGGFLHAAALVVKKRKMISKKKAFYEFDVLECRRDKMVIHHPSNPLERR
jgi:hypothetical protein